jgi:hypothetical protein
LTVAAGRLTDTRVVAVSENPLTVQAVALAVVCADSHPPDATARLIVDPAQPSAVPALRALPYLAIAAFASDLVI